jgi:hypothetical protein
VGWAARESFDLQPGGVLRLDGVGEGIGRVRPPGDRAVAQGDVVGVLDGEAGRLSKSAPLNCVVRASVTETRSSVMSWTRLTALPQIRTEFSAVPVTFVTATWCKLPGLLVGVRGIAVSEMASPRPHHGSE